MSLLLGVLLPALALAAAWVWRHRCVGFNCGTCRHVLGIRRKEGGDGIVAVLIPGIREPMLQQVDQWERWLSLNKQEDAAWNWRDILLKAELGEAVSGWAFEAYTLVLNRKVLALLLLRTGGWTSRNPEAAGPLVYVEHLAVAPEGRRGSPERRYLGCGEALLEFAAHRSQRLGHGGRLALHSLPGSEVFYRKAGLRDFGPDPQEEGLRYFESEGNDV